MAMKMTTRVLAAGAAGAVCLTVGSGAIASAAPALDPPKPGTSSPKLDPQTPAAPTPAAPAPVQQSEAPAREYVPGYVPLYSNAPSKPMSNYDYSADDNYSGGGIGYYTPEDSGDPVAPITPEIIAVVEAPKKKVRFGDYVADQTDLFTERQWNMINNTAADLEAGYGNIYRTLGVEASRADRIAAATIGTGAAGAVVGAVPGAVVGGLIGGTIGGNIGAATGGAIGVALPPPLPALVAIPTGVAGTGVGAVAGAAVGGAMTAVPGALVGAAIGTATGAGEATPDPIEVELPNRPKVDTELVTGQTQQAVQQVSAAPGGTGVVESVRAAVIEAPKLAAAANTTVRAAIASVPGGAEATAAVDTFNANVSMFVEPIATPIHDAVTAAQTGLLA